MRISVSGGPGHENISYTHISDIVICEINPGVPHTINVLICILYLLMIFSLRLFLHISKPWSKSPSPKKTQVQPQPSPNKHEPKEGHSLRLNTEISNSVMIEIGQLTGQGDSCRHGVPRLPCVPCVSIIPRGRWRPGDTLRT